MSEHNSLLTTHKWLMPSAAVTGLLLVILYALGILGGPDKVEPGTAKAGGQALPAGAQIFKVGQQSAANTLSWQGTVRSRTVAKISPKLSARILEVLVHPGDKVHKGDVIARLDDRDLRAAYNAASAAQAAAQAQAGQAGAEEKRMVDLYGKQAATRQSYDAALAQAKAARAVVGQAAGAAQQAKVMLGENVLYAPFDGVISERLKEPGDMAMPSEAVAVMYKPDDLRFEAAIANHCFEQVKLGMPVTVRLDALHRSVPAQVDEIAPEIDPQTHTRMIKVNLPANDGLQHGQYGWLELSCQADRQTLLIPSSAVLHYGQLQAVKVVDGGQLHTRHIRTGKLYGEQIEVLSGLRDGETVLGNSGLANTHGSAR
ncbi:efflux RND transporter periplasmic adaptor subunit [Methylomonas sp. LL1]|uniref:efflux RND transporter periplasmic adaptor subunit n=1 Tax=Methylomonas sp. LL1 TaxID=2785785 RepID=UPI0018C44BC0|nr:efflux RND transporter periplasmic adaptor subunit [Methylomonas sp. LL1]QPK63438.1 efflux RND transporter periplasmic adaptor subunit [Methylomonas sp. LL1]